MSFSRYTGYSMNGTDVFVWVLLTAGSIGFPMLVLTICCIKNRIKNKSSSLLNSESVMKIDQLNKLPLKNSTHTETSINERYNHVRFNEDNLKSKNKPVKNTGDNIQDLRNFKQISGNILANNNKPNTPRYEENPQNLPSLPSIPIYSMPDSYRVPNISGQVNSSYRKEDSFENLYSQVPSKKSTNQTKQDLDDNQPVYMNSYYNGE